MASRNERFWESQSFTVVDRDVGIASPLPQPRSSAGDGASPPTVGAPVMMIPWTWFGITTHASTVTWGKRRGTRDQYVSTTRQCQFSPDMGPLVLRLRN